MPRSLLRKGKEIQDLLSKLVTIFNDDYTSGDLAAVAGEHPATGPA